MGGGVRRSLSAVATRIVHDHLARGAILTACLHQRADGNRSTHGKQSFNHFPHKTTTSQFTARTQRRYQFQRCSQSAPHGTAKTHRLRAHRQRASRASPPCRARARWSSSSNMLVRRCCGAVPATAPDNSSRPDNRDESGGRPADEQQGSKERNVAALLSRHLARCATTSPTVVLVPPWTAARSAFTSAQLKRE